MTIKDTFKDEEGTLHTLVDMLPAQPGDEDYINVTEVNVAVVNINAMKNTHIGVQVTNG